MVTEPTAVVFVNAKKLAVVPVPVLMLHEEAPADAVTGTVSVAKAATKDAFTADALTVEPAKSPVTSNLTASAAPTELSAGTVTVAGVADEAAVVTATPFTERAIVGTFALAGATVKAEPIKAAERTTADR